MGALVCTHCGYDNPELSQYCQHCGAILKKKKGFHLGNETPTLAGTGARGSSIAPLGGLAIAKQASELTIGKRAAKFPRIPIEPLEDGTWYCPLCGDENVRQKVCKGCGFDAQL